MYFPVDSENAHTPFWLHQSIRRFWITIQTRWVVVSGSQQSKQKAGEENKKTSQTLAYEILPKSNQLQDGAYEACGLALFLMS